MPWIISRCYIWYMQTWRSDILRHCFNTCDSLPYNFRDKSSCYQPPTVQHDGREEQCLTEVSHLSLDGGNDHAFFHTLVHATPLVCQRPSGPRPRGQTPLRVKYLGLSISLELKKTLGWEAKCVQGSKKSFCSPSNTRLKTKMTRMTEKLWFIYPVLQKSWVSPHFSILWSDEMKKKMPEELFLRTRTDKKAHLRAYLFKLVRIVQTQFLPHTLYFALCLHTFLCGKIWNLKMKLKHFTPLWDISRATISAQDQDFIRFLVWWV